MLFLALLNVLYKGQYLPAGAHIHLPCSSSKDFVKMIKPAN